MKPQKERRKKINYSIKRQMQLKFLLRVLLIVTVAVGIMGMILYFYSDRKIASSYTQFHIQARNFLDWLLPVILFSLCVALLCALLLSLPFPHKVAGPLYRIERELQQKVGTGDLTVRFILRKGDEVHDLAKAINASLDMLGTKVKTMKERAETISDLLQREEVDLDELRKEFGELKKTLDEFRV